MPTPSTNNNTHSTSQEKLKFSITLEEGIQRIEHYLDTGESPLSSDGKPILLTTKEKVELYTWVYDKCTEPDQSRESQPKLYELYGETLASYIREKVIPILRETSSDKLLYEFYNRWTNHRLYAKKLWGIFAYLDRHYTISNQKVPLYKKGISIFKELVFDEFKNDISSTFLSMVSKERSGMAADDQILKNIVDIYLHLSKSSAEDIESIELFVPKIYENELENALLPETSAFYSSMASVWIKAGFPAYLKKIEDSLEAESKRCHRYLPVSSENKLQRAVIDSLLVKAEVELANKADAIFKLLEDKEIESLRRLYKLFSLIEKGTQELSQLVRAHVTQLGMALAEEQIIKPLQALPSQTPKALQKIAESSIQSFILLLEQMKELILKCFVFGPETGHQIDPLFQIALKDAFEAVINPANGNYSFEVLLSLYTNNILKKAGENWDEIKYGPLFDKIVDLFSCILEKDIFAEHYRNHLSKRLLNDKFCSVETEKCMISKLKMKCGAQFTSKIEGMINDIAVSHDLQTEFRNYVNDDAEAKNALGKIEFSVQTLTAGCWPNYLVHSINVAPVIQNYQTIFENFYIQQTQHRRLTWMHPLGSVTLSSKLKHRHLLVCNAYQASLLLLFNTEEALDIQSIQASLGLDDQFIRRILQSLSTEKIPILKRLNNDSEKDLNTSSDPIYGVNNDFEGATFKLKIPCVIQEDTYSRERVEEDRSMAIDATLIRIMKSKRVISHQQLIADSLELLHHFKPSTKAIKARIEHLIEREYLERDPCSPSMYMYIS